MKEIWANDEASYSGKYVNFDRVMSYPKPAQRPHPPILVGGTGPTVLDRVLAFGDAWFPNYWPGGVRPDRRAARPRRPAGRRAGDERARRPEGVRAAGAAGVRRVRSGCRPARARGSSGRWTRGRRRSRTTTRSERAPTTGAGAVHICRLPTADAARLPRSRRKPPTDYRRGAAAALTDAARARAGEMRKRVGVMRRLT